MAKKKLTYAQRRAALLKRGLCGTCGQRPRAKNPAGGTYKECRTCLDYFAAWARKQHKAK